MKKSCRVCRNACPYGSIKFDRNGKLSTWDICKKCETFDCVNICPNNALKQCVKEYMVDEIMLINLLRFYKVNILTKTSLLEVKDEGAVVLRDRHRQTLPSDAIIIAAGFKPNDELFCLFSGKVSELYLIGE